MGKLWMPVQNFKKIHEDDKHAILQHPDGHEVTLAKNILSDHMKGQLAALPLHKAGGGSIRGRNPSGGVRTLPNAPNVRAYPMPMGPGPRRMADGGALQQADPNDPQVQKMMHDQTIMADQQRLMAQAQQGGGQGAGATAQSQPQGQGQGPTNMQIPGMQQRPQQNPYGQGIPGVGCGQSATDLLGQGMREQLAGAKTNMNAQQAGAGQIINAANNTQRDLNTDVNNFWNGYTAPDGRKMPGYNDRIKEIDSVKSDILSNNINPNHYFESGAFPKIITAIGLLGAMSNSKGAGEQILNFVSQQMDRDVKSQAENQSNKMNVVKANMGLLGNMQDAMTMTRAQHMAVFSALLDKAAATTNSEAAKGTYQGLSGQVHQQMAQMVYEWTKQGVLGQPVGVGGTGQTGGQAGAQGTDASGAPSPKPPQDAVGNPLGQGMNVNPSFYQENNPVKLPGGGYGFAGDKSSKSDADKAVIAHQQLDNAIKGVMQTQNEGRSMPSVFGMMTDSRARKANAMDSLHAAVRNVINSGGRLTPMQQSALEQMGNITENPLIHRSKEEQQVKDLGNVNNDAVNSTLSSTVNNYTPPRKPGNDTKWNGG